MAGVSSSIHFRGAEQVLQAYNDRGVDAWSLWQGKQFLVKGIGGQELDTFIQHLVNSCTSAIYTLKVYDDIDDVKKIKEKTEADGSFNFRLLEPDQMPGVQRITGYNQELERRMEAMDRKFDLLMEQLQDDADDDDEPEDAGLMGALTGMLRDPEKLERMIGVARSLLGGVSAPAPHVLGNVNRLQPGAAPGAPVSPEEKLQRLGAAIDTLERHDPLLVEHLERLAAMAKEKPGQFSNLISMLDVL